VEMQISTTTMDINMEVPQNAKNRAIIWSSFTTHGHISEGMQVSIHKDTLHTYVFCNTIHNS
jgi:hypothetical protein